MGGYPISIVLSFSSFIITSQRWGWLRHCTTSQKVAGSIPDGVRILH